MKKLLLVLVTLFTAHTIFACTASFTSNLAPTNNDLLRVAFNNTSTSGSANGFVGSATIDYGDGIIQSNPFQQNTVYHNYANPGTYTVKLRIEVVDSVNNTRNVCRDSVTHTVTVGYGPCASKITTTKVNDSTYTFAATTPAGTSGMTYNWSFGDGGTATGSPVTHTYHASSNTTGTATVTLTATSTTNCSYTNKVNVTVPVPRPPFNCANANASFNVVIANNVVTIQNTSTGPGANVHAIYTFNYGDNTPNTTSTIHTYAAIGNYKIMMYAKWDDSLHQCYDTADKRAIITVIPPPPPTPVFNCGNANASFNATISGNVVTIQNTSAKPSINARAIYTFNYGDNTANTTSMSHTYAAAGTYKIMMYAKWDDSSTHICLDTADKKVTITNSTPANNRIEGAVFGDSINAASYKVWLIVFDARNLTLTAVDSAFTNNGNGSTRAAFKFDNKPAATYLVKAMQVMNNTTARPTMIPTYSLRSPYWAGAKRIVHTNGTETGNNIFMIPGIPRRGPGFIGGSIRHGANRMARTTGADGDGIMVIIKDKATGEPVDFTYTDANGAYSFSDIEDGDYTIYPEVDGYTTVEANVSLKDGAETINNVNFRVNTASQIVTPEATAVATIETAATLSIYPNPTTGIVNIKGLQKGLNNVVVADVAGRVVLQTTIDYVSGTSTIDLSAAGAGVYFINIKTEGVNYTNKLILQH